MAEIVSQDEKATYVELYANQQNISEVLINEQHALKSESTPEVATTGFVSHINSPSEFWMQLESSVADLEWIADQLSGAESFPELEDFMPGSLCAAVFPEDDNWYRARILSNTVAGIEVLFIDYGNSCTCRCLRALPEDLVMMPALAQKCSLQKPSGIEQWTPQAAEKFKEIAAEGVTIFNFRKLSTGETAVVELLLEGKDISLQLLPKTVDCYITKFDSLESFYIKKHDQEKQLSEVCKLESLPGITWDEDSNNAFLHINNEGNTLYQVEFVTSGVVRLYLDGRDIRSQLGGAKNASTMSTPKKYFDVQSKSTDSSSIQEDMSELVVEVIQNAVDSTEVSQEKQKDKQGVDEINDNKEAATSETKQDITQAVSDILGEIAEGVVKREIEPETSKPQKDKQGVDEIKENKEAATSETKQDITQAVSDILGEIAEGVVKREIGPEICKPQEGDSALDSIGTEENTDKTEDTSTSDMFDKSCDNNGETEVVPIKVAEDSEVEKAKESVGADKYDTEVTDNVDVLKTKNVAVDKVEDDKHEQKKQSVDNSEVTQIKIEQDSKIVEENNKDEKQIAKSKVEESKIEKEKQVVESDKDNSKVTTSEAEDLEIKEEKQSLESNKDTKEKSTAKQLNGVCTEIDLQMVTETLEDIVQSAVKGNPENISTSTDQKVIAVEDSTEENKKSSLSHQKKDIVSVKVPSRDRTPATSRSSSRCSGRFIIEDRVVPGAISRPQTPEKDGGIADSNETS